MPQKSESPESIDLTLTERRVVYGYLFLGQNFAQIGRELGISREGARAAYKSAARKTFAPHVLYLQGSKK